MYKSKYRRRVEEAIDRYRMKGTGLKKLSGGGCTTVHVERKIKTIPELLDAIEKRAKTETQLRQLFLHICDLLEPPGCMMAHCKSYGGAFSWANCKERRIPGKCAIFRRFLKRKRKRELGE